jgi:hypothetical protein
MSAVVVGTDDLSRNELLDRADVLQATVRRAEAEVLVLAVRFALLHGAAEPAGAKPLPGRAGLKQLGGSGTPLVAEFAPVMLGARLGLSPHAGAGLIADALDMYYRLPALWGRVAALDVKASYAREVARRTRDLARQEAALVDEQVAEEADGRLPWSRFIDLLDAAIISADPIAAAEEERKAATRPVAAPTRSSEYGMRGFFVHAPFPVIARLDATVAYLAQALADLGDSDGLDERRVKAVLILANPTQAVHLLRGYATWRAHQPSRTDDGGLAAKKASHPELDRPQHPNPADREPPTLVDPEFDGPQSSNQAIREPLLSESDLAADDRFDLPDAESASSEDPEADAPRPAPADRESSATADPELDKPQTFNPAEVSAKSGSADAARVVDDADLLPAARLFVHLTQETIESNCATGVARVEGLPPITAQWVKDHFGGCRVTVTPVLDLAHQIPVDAWEIPGKHRHAVH